MSILILFFLALLSLCSADNLARHVCPNTTTFTPNSTFQNNRDQLLSSLVSNATRVTGFYQTSAGGTDTVEGLLLCRGDVPPDACYDCVHNAASEVVQRCPIEKQAIICYDECMVRYSNQSFLSTASEEFFLYTSNESSLTTQTGALVPQFNQTLKQTMDVVVPKIINAALKFATQGANITRLITLYSAGQCTQDLSTKDCMNCLTDAEALLSSCCFGKKGGTVKFPSCNIRFEVYPFYKSQVIKVDSRAPPPSPASIANPPPTPPALVVAGKSKLLFIVIPSILAPVALCVLVAVVARCFIHKSKRAKQQQNKGEGGFGQVFKGTLDNGQEIAVKRLSKSSGQGVREFKNEVLLVAKLQHRNLVRLLGFCLEREEILLVYEYVPNKSLDYFLFEAEKREQLDWSRRCTII
ncbi:hypothetical protein ACLB2K_024320 [Fragaria x ananassa]